MAEMTACWVAYTTIDSKEKAAALANRLVKEKWVACATIVGPVESVYEWQGDIEHATEWMLMMKCADEQLQGLKKSVADWHDYAVPELIVLPVADGHAPYLDWVRASARGKA
ncbi:MAG: divalent-cation tolerance protein CutA [Gammaproteobacteria bacterium]|uniref:divalent-cation tolerance protein CutA n=1 Tax=Limnobacter sp. TaxID=2003368 RepID=UPI001DCAF746|nr:divalent-cation tolerance protein CutA [Limnobacter sp.]MBU0784797.1 divalent-cation tolerance protein CutA [Gammaproteobacteria bacterium]MBU0848182.1 divalent-cation tolerance protein CutA [Gammaproteobacteria bacterium]MBU1266400.1 divalent-cation tolerance protein CutA [Gammaproteobacteria bacterium]MBU1527889.1 divalent-cation tolerance protein CutA [Gammaproteobacteria bacterium]MBU1779781.1 divalent-cation tolerance protein CutA [Gammaproteobacteria bacterium]